jgi:hypothetical protein
VSCYRDKSQGIRCSNDEKDFGRRTDKDFIAISVSFVIFEAESLFACTTSFSVASNIWRPMTHASNHKNQVAFEDALTFMDAMGGFWRVEVDSEGKAEDGGEK